MKKTLLLFLELSLLLILTNSCSAQNYTTYYLTGGVFAGNGGSDPVNTITLQGSVNTIGGYVINLPPTIGTSGYVLTTDGNNPANLSWAASGGTGTVTSVAMTVPSILSVSGSPITTSGTLAITYSGTALPIANGGTGQTTRQAAIDALTSVSGVPNTYVYTTNGTNGGWSAPPGGFANPMTTLGDIIYENATPAAARLAGNTTTTKNFLTQTGNGTISAAPVWGTIASGDIPSGSSNYIQNNPGSQQTANFWVGGLGISQIGANLVVGTANSIAGGVSFYSASNPSTDYITIAPVGAITSIFTLSLPSINGVFAVAGSGGGLLTAGTGISISNASNATTITATVQPDSARTFNSVIVTSGSTTSLSSSNISGYTNCIVAMIGANSTTVNASFTGVEILLYNHDGNASDKIIAGSGITFYNSTSTITLPATTGAAIMLTCITTGYYLVTTIP